MDFKLTSLQNIDEDLVASFLTDSLQVRVGFENDLQGDFHMIVTKATTAVLSDFMMMGDGTAPFEDDHMDALSELVNQDEFFENCRQNCLSELKSNADVLDQLAEDIICDEETNNFLKQVKGEIKATPDQLTPRLFLISKIAAAIIIAFGLLNYFSGPVTQTKEIIQHKPGRRTTSTQLVVKISTPNLESDLSVCRTDQVLTDNQFITSSTATIQPVIVKINDHLLTDKLNRPGQVASMLQLGNNRKALYISKPKQRIFKMYSYNN